MSLLIEGDLSNLVKLMQMRFIGLKYAVYEATVVLSYFISEPYHSEKSFDTAEWLMINSLSINQLGFKRSPPDHSF